MDTIKFIGKVHSSLKTLDDCPRQEHEDAPDASVEVYAEFMEGLKNLRKGDQIILLTWLHQADRSVLSTHPRNDITIPLTGVFSTRSPDRPNPIGLHFVKVTSISDDGKFGVSGLEVLDQTPVVDIKPDLK